MRHHYCSIPYPFKWIVGGRGWWEWHFGSMISFPAGQKRGDAALGHCSQGTGPGDPLEKKRYSFCVQDDIIELLPWGSMATLQWVYRQRCHKETLQWKQSSSENTTAGGSQKAYCNKESRSTSPHVATLQCTVLPSKIVSNFAFMNVKHTPYTAAGIEGGPQTRERVTRGLQGTVEWLLYNYRTLSQG